MKHPAHHSQCSAALYVSVELSSQEWLLTMAATVGGPRRRVRMRPGDAAALGAALTAARAAFGLPAAAPVRSCYEAGRDGFWPHRFLAACGVSNCVVDSSSIEVPRRARRTKTDRVDGEQLLRLLLRHWAGERGVWHVVTVPTPAQEEARHASRGLTTLQRERTRYRNRIHGLLALHGVRRLRLDAQLPRRLAATTDWAGAPLPAGVQARVLETWRVLHAVEAERQTRRRLERQRARGSASSAPTLVQRLARVRGVAARTATVLADELFGRSLRNRREVGALTGLVAAPYRSGTIARDHGLAQSGLPAVRRIAVELAWAWRRYQPHSALTQWYERRFGHGGAVTRKIGIVALARRIIVALWHYVTQDRLPAGAQLKAA